MWVWPGPSGEARAGHFSNAVKLRQMEAVDGADLFSWHSSTVVLEDGEEGGGFDELDPAVRPGGAGLDRQLRSQIGGRVHPTQIQLQPTRPHQEV